MISPMEVHYGLPILSCVKLFIGRDDGVVPGVGVGAWDPRLSKCYHLYCIESLLLRIAASSNLIEDDLTVTASFGAVFALRDTALRLDLTPVFVSCGPSFLALTTRP
jgi:hypothetical protein